MTNSTNTTDRHDISSFVYDVHVYPTYAVQLPQREKFKPSKEAIARAQQTRLERLAAKNSGAPSAIELGPVLSAKAKRRLINAVNWLISSAKTKRIFSKENGKTYSFKVNFITLTLPTTDHEITDHFFKSKLLHNFLSTSTAKFGLSNYVWKVEAQENGNIHAHITTDVFMPWKEVRSVWNKILRDNGLIDSYTRKHSRMSKDEYLTVYSKGDLAKFKALEIAYEKGVSENWTDPNTTDVHAVHKVKDLGAYLAKYFSKNEEDRRRIKGRVWSCSYNLSAANKLVVECTTDRHDDVLPTLCFSGVDVKELIQEPKNGKSAFSFGLMYFFKPHHWGTVLKGRLFEEYNRHRLAIRGSKAGLFSSRDPVELTVENCFNKEILDYKPPVKQVQNVIQDEQATLLFQL
jgi:hypothetical protein